MSPPPYTTIPLHQLCTVYCIHWFGLFVSKTMSPPPYTTIPVHPLCTASIVYCIHWFDLFAPKTMSPPPYTTIQLHTASTGLTFLHQRQCPHHHIPLFHCVHCVLCPLRTASTPSSHLCVILTQPDICFFSSIFRGRFVQSQPTSGNAQSKDLDISADAGQHKPEDARFFLILS